MQIPSISSAPFLVPQGAKYVSTRRMPGGSKPAHDAHDQGKRDGAEYHDRRHLQAEYDLAERHLILRSRGHAVERQHQDNPNCRAEQRQQHRLKYDRG